MIRRHIIDKFGHSLFLGKRGVFDDGGGMEEDVRKRFRSSEGSDILDKFIELQSDIDIIKEQLNSFKSKIEEKERSIKSNDDHSWEGENKRISHVADGVDQDDVSTVRQTLTFDSEKNIFKCGDKEFDLVINDPIRPVLLADTSYSTGFATYNGNEYRPRHRQF